MKKNTPILLCLFILLTNQLISQTIPDSLLNLPRFEKRDLKNSISTTRGSAETCGTNPNQFTIQIVSDSSYNGYDLKCADECSGFYTVNVTGGIGPFTFQWLGGGDLGTKNSQSWTNVCDQNSIQVLVTDIGQGITCAASHVLSVPDRLRTINFSLTPPSCNYNCDGFATHSPVFGVPPYSFLWGSGATTQNATNLCVGITTLRITDRNGCQFDTLVNVTDPPPISTNMNISEVTCNNACDGSLTSVASGGTGAPYTYAWTNAGTGASAGNSNTVSNLCENDSYSLRIVDNSGCFIDTTVTLADKQPMSISVASSTDAQCFTTCNGQTSLLVTGGVPPYVNYSWYKGIMGSGILQPFSGQTVNNLCAYTNYYVVVTDSDGCQDSLSIPSLISPPAIVITENHTDNNCSGDNNGTINIQVSGGTSSTGTYTYSWTTNNGSGLSSNSQNQTGLSGGTYQVIVTDDVGCQDSISVTINEPAIIAINAIISDVTCFNLTDGTIDLTTTGGTGSYTWSWTSTDGSFVNPNTEDLSGLDSASYTVRVTDANGCYIDSTFSITKPDEIYVNGVSNTITCNSNNDGQITISPTNGVGTYTYDWDIDGTGDFDDTQNQTNLSPNTYNLSILDGNGCQKDTTFNITEPSPITISPTISNPSCNQPNGSITAVVSGGTPNYTYIWKNSSGITIGTTQTISNLPDDCYDVFVTDANSCTETQQICIVGVTPPTATLTPNDVSCNGSCDGSVLINISGGTAPFNTSWTSTDPNFVDPNTDNIFLLCAADYTLTLTDADNCTYTQTITINDPLPISIADVVTPVSCNGGNDGSINITPTGGTISSNYSYNWTGSNSYSNSSEDISGLYAGTYTVTVTDDNNCSNSSTYNITEPTPITVTTNPTNSQCGTYTGSITTTVSGGTPGYNYSWTDIGGNTVGGNTATLSNQQSGIYNLSVTDINGCTETLTTTISDDQAPTLTVDNFGDVTCNGFNDGYINITATGGTGTLTYSWTSIPVGYTSNSEDINLLSGNTTYNITVTDANGCSANQSVYINDPMPISFSSNTIQPSCNGGGNGSIDITILGGTSPFTFDWDNDGTGDFDDPEDLINIPAGTYTVSIIDNGNCPQTQTFTLNEPTEISLTSSSINSTCTQSDGSATIVATNGTPIPPNTYNYQWTPTGQTTPVLGVSQTLPNQPAGCYDVLVTDANNCTQIGTVCISDNNSPNLTTNTTDVSCFGSSDGSINLSITGGQTPYNPIIWSGPSSIPNGSLNGNNLQDGIYSVQVTDGAGCIGTIVDTINEPLQISITGVVNNPNCNNGNNGSINVTTTNGVAPFSYSWTGPSGFVNPSTEDLNGITAGTYCITVTDANNCSRLQCFIINDPAPINITTSSTPSNCTVNTGQLLSTVSGGTPTYTYNWVNSLGTSVGTSTNVNNLGADNYTLTVTDNNGCSVSATETITEINAPTVSLVSSNDVLCKGDATGSIVISVTGGTAPYVFDWDNLAGNNDPQNQNNLSAGTYTVTTNDANGCTSNLSVSINEPSLALSANGVSLGVICNGTFTGAIDLTVTGGTPNYNYSWSNSGTTEDLNGLGTGNYSVIVTDNNGCQAFDTTQIISTTALNLTMNSNGTACGTNNGSVSVTVTGGTPNYNYSWTDITSGQPGTSIGTNSNNVNFLPAGSYQVVITDNNNCIDSSVVSISNTNGANVTANITDVLCYGGASGAIDITVTGTPSFTYNWTGPLPFPGAITEDISSVEAGTYTVSITDGNNCITNQVFTINGPTAPIQDNALTNNLLCYNDTTGSIDITPTGGTVPYTYSWTGPNAFSSNSEDVNNLISGNYILNISDNNGCAYTNTITVTEPDSIKITPTLTNPSCGASDGQISVSVTGGTISSSYTYSWVNLTTGAILGTTNTINSISADNYQVTVIDDNGCTKSLIIPLSDSNAPTLSTSIIDADCFGASTGSINLTVGSTGTYTYDWDNDGTGDNDDTEDLNSIPAGTYNVVVTDVNTGCVGTASAVVSESPILNITSNLINLNCYNDNTGSIDITVSGGNAPYTYDWDNDGTGDNDDTEDLNSIPAGTYSVTVIDANGCQVANVYTITEPANIETPSLVNNNNCFGQAQGTIDISVINGVAPFSYTWTGPLPFAGSTNEDLSNLYAGTYNLTVIGANGCRKDTSITITEPNAINLLPTITDANCNVNDGAISVSVSGGTLTTSTDYTYNWQSGGSTISTTNSINAVGAGAYLLSVIDDNGCRKDSLMNINNTNAPIVTIDSVSNITCFGGEDGAIYVTITGGVAPYSQIWNSNAINNTEDITNIPAGNYTITVTDNVGCIISADTSLIEPAPILTSVSVIDAVCDSCNGGATITTTGGVGNITYLWSNNSTNNNVQNLCAGIYPVLISDDNNCTNNTNVIVNNSGGPSGENITLNNVSCNGGNDGSITVSAIGGTAPYTYFWPHNNSTSNTINNLTAGTYIVQMKDANNCLRSVPISITEPSAINALSFVTPSSCTVNDGSIVLNISGGVSPYNINWQGTLGSNSSVNNLGSGIYTVTITDDSSCSATFNFNLPNVSSPSISLSGVDLSCYNDNSGQISSSIMGASGVVSYQWFSGATAISGATTSSINNISAGNYTLVVTDNSTGCENQSTITISEPTPLGLSLPTVSPTSCSSVCNGSALALPIGGTLGYNYSWNNGSSNAQQANNLCSGINTVTITDANNCSIEQNIQIDENNTLSATISNTDSDCGQCNGVSSIVPNGGTGNYSILWADGSTNLTHNNLCAGVHPFEITDNNGCSKQLQSVISNNGGPTGETISTTDVSCNGGNNGSALVTPIGGTPPYSYLWIPTGATSNSINGVEAGIYHLEITDSNRCTRVVPVEIVEPQELLINDIITNANCGNNDGSIVITINGSNAPYTANWTGPNGYSNTGQTLLNLEPGLYNLTITDNNACVKNYNYAVSSTSSPSISITKNNISCFGKCDGNALITVNPSSGNYTYNWIGTSNSTASINNLCAGLHYVEVVDVNSGCSAVQNILIEEPDSISIEVPFIDNPTCFEYCDGLSTVVVTGGTLGYTYNWLTGSTTETQNNLCVGQSKVFITDANGCVDSTVINVVEPTEIIINTDSTTNSECKYSTEGAIYTTVTGGTQGYNYDWQTYPSSSFSANTEDITGLLPTNYIITITDNNNCIKRDTIEIDTNYIVVAKSASDTAVCLGNCVTIFGTGQGASLISYEWFDEYGNSLSSVDSVELCLDTAKIHNVILRVSDQFCYDTDTTALTIWDLPIVDAGEDISELFSSEVVLGGNPTSPTGNIFEWKPLTNILNGSENQPNPTIELNEEENYIVIVTDTNGCINSDTIHVKPMPNIDFPNGFSPNDDGVNDYWRIDLIKEFPEAVVEVYNRWGQLLFRSIGYNEPFDGIYKGKRLPVGTYYYIIKLNDPNYPNAFTGPVTIMR